jgi:hypothetical protein
LLRRTRIAGCPHLLLTTAHDSRAHRTPGNGLRHRPVV